MKARKIVLLAAGLLAAGIITKASADYVIRDANSITQTVFAYVCSTSKICPASVLTDSTGVEKGTGSNPVRTDPTGTTPQPISATSLPLPPGAATAANQSSVIGTKAPGAAAASSMLVGGIYNAISPILTDGQQSAFQFDASGALRISGGGSGGTSSSFATAFPATGTAIGAKNGANMVSVGADGSGNLNVNCAVGCSSSSAITGWAGGTLGAMANYGTSPGAVLVPGVNSFITNIPHVVCDSGCSGSGGTSATDETAFTYGTSTYTPSGGVYNASITNLTSGQGGAVALTAARAFTIDALSGSNLATLLSAGTANFGAAYPSSGIAPGGKAQSSEPAAATTGNLTASFFDLAGKQVTSPYANRENMVRGSASSTNTSAHTLIAAGGAGIKTYITAIQCGRTDAGTSAIAVTFSDAAADVMVIPNNGGGGGNNQTFPVPLATAANTAFTFTSGTSTSTVYCSAQGFSGY